MRTSIIAWSAVSGLLLALFLGALLIGLSAMAAALLPGSVGRFVTRWRVEGLVLLLVIVPLLGAIAGFLEGKLKAE